MFTTAGSPQRLFALADTGGPNCVIFAGCSFRIVVRNGIAQLISRTRARETVGILVQRIVGTRRVHGKRVPRTRNVGRVPLGSHKRGKLKLRWNLNVKHKRLKPGTYRVLLRALDRHGNVLGVTKPARLKIKKK